ncbi:hypothetical protein SPHINGO391_390181 [Sphingomonas aurantiaca]|uniref:Uncharacterized protein n=1 Tax=Sphingomonas aurantiaca TaxID=185949 RepID=A0A5E7YNR5_9SPHN|nr:hypothetical protein SPHINGO391_390181 [Sphingomonas aurantiaca]
MPMHSARGTKLRKSLSFSGVIMPPCLTIEPGRHFAIVQLRSNIGRGDGGAAGVAQA